MTDFPYLRNAPIKEALSDIQCECDKALSVDELKSKLVEPFKEREFQSPKLIRQFEFHGMSGEGEIVTGSKDTLLGYRYDSKDETKVIQTRINGFTFSHLKPYQRWDDFKDEWSELWGSYKDVAKPTKINRVAIRYINVIEPSSGINTVSDLSKSFVEPPRVADALPQTLSQCLSRFVLKVDEFGGSAIVTKALERKPNNQDPVLVLDIDIFKFEPANGIKDDEISALLEQMREVKNNIFFKSLTQSLIDEFK